MAFDTVEETLRQAKKLVYANRYEEAYKLLKGVDDPKAKRWREELVSRYPNLEQEDLASKISADAFFAVNLNDYTVVDFAGMEKPKHEIVEERAWNPILIFLAFPVNAVWLSLNWERLGRRTWAGISATISVLSLFAAVFLAVLLFVEWGNRTWIVYEQSWQLPTTFYALAAIVGLSLGMALSFAISQYQSYRLIYHDMIHYAYNIPLMFVVIFLVTGLVVGAAHYTLGYTVLPRQADAGDMVMHYPAGWEVFVCEPMEGEMECITHLAIHDGSTYRWVTVTFMSYPLGDWENAAQIQEEKLPRYLSNVPDSAVWNVEERTIGSHMVVIRDSTEGLDQCANYVRQVYAVHEGQAYQITINASCHELWEKFYADIEMITNSLEFR